MRLHRSATGAGGTGPNISTPDLTNIRQASDAAMGKQTNATVGQMAPPVSAAGLSPPGAVMGPPQGVTGGGGSARRGSLTKESIARHNKK